MDTPHEPQTHQAIEMRLCGEPRELREGYCRVEMTTGDEMRADERGLVHGGFVFGLADYAAMLAVNQPNVVLGSAQARFLKPVVSGDELTAEATVVERDGRKQIVAVDVERGGELVFRGEFVCFIPERHILDKPGR
ncbi:MAG: PaaI family thioesterase [Thermoanaerobaculia bacterium]